MHLKRVKHALSRHDNLLRLLFNWQASDQSCHFFSSLPLCKLAKALLTSPHARVDNLEEQLTRLRVENEDGAINRLRRQVALKSLVDRHAIDISVIDKPNDLV